LYAARILEFLGETGTAVISRLFDLVLPALAVPFISTAVHTRLSRLVPGLGIRHATRIFRFEH
jgi:small neutral amino acid transporter SnatA (MarC family)